LSEVDEAHPELDLSVQELIYAGLEALEAAISLDLCAYLHVSGDFGPQLFLSSPNLANLSPAVAFDLFSGLRDALDWAALNAVEAGVEQICILAGYESLTVATSGPISRGLFAVGRTARPLLDQERHVATRLCSALGNACHRLEAAVTSVRLHMPGELPPHSPQT
jgi:hypothetical protein